MSLKSRTDRRYLRGWAGIAAGGLLSTAVVLSGIGWATADDEKPVKPGARPEKKAPSVDGDHEGDGKRADSDEVAKLKKQIEAAVKDGDAKEVQRLVGQLERALSPKPAPRDGDGRRPDLLRGDAPGPQFAPGAPFRIVPMDDAQAREMTERMFRTLEQRAEQMRDNPAQQDAIRRAMEKMRNDFGPGGPTLVPLGRDGRANPGRFGTAIARLPEVLSDQLDLPKGTGLVVVDVARDSAAEKAGVKKNDILLRFAGKDVTADERQFMEMIGAAKGGEKVEVVVLRKGKKETIAVDLPEPPKPARREGEGRVEGKGGKVAFQSMATTVTDDKFEVKASKGDTRYQIKGRIEDGRPVPVKITVSDGDDSNTYDSPKDVPEEHRPALRQLLAAVGG